MPSCTFFGHRDCFALDRERLMAAIEALILQGVDTFYVGNQGNFDGMVRGCLKQLCRKHPSVRYAVVLAYLPATGEGESDTMYPEIEGHPRFAIERRNRWMLTHADYCLCYVEHSWGGAWRYARLAKKKGVTVSNLGRFQL